MKKTAPDGTTTDDAPPATAAPAEVIDEGQATGERLLDPQHEWPSAGGSYVRQTNGTLKRED